NAIKHHDRDGGQIIVRTRLEPGEMILEVEDDGPGICPFYQEKVFELFQTLRPRDEVEGTGLGLPIVKKLAEECRGSVTVRSDPDRARGTLFRVQLPDRYDGNDGLSLADQAAA
ncbi:MAG: sensor histidine kinase, partial [Sulfitobacter sp.]|nr:sensor histidine kinase [Sulfitobacter sp.]